MVQKRITIHRTKAEIANHLKSYKASGKSCSLYCKENGIAYPSFRNWLTGKSRAVKIDEKPMHNAFEKIEIRNLLPNITTDSRFELVCNSHQLFIPQDFKRDSLQRLKEVLGTF